MKQQGSKWMVVDADGDSVDTWFRSEDTANARLADRLTIAARIIRADGPVD